MKIDKRSLKKIPIKASSASVIACVVALSLTGLTQSASVRSGSNFTANVLTANGDGSPGPVALKTANKFFGPNYDSLFSNEDSNVFSDNISIPSGLLDTETLINVNPGTRETFFFPVAGETSSISSSNLLNASQFAINDLSDVSAENLNFKFNDDSIPWKTGNSSGQPGEFGGSAGIGGSPARTVRSEVDTNNYGNPSSGQGDRRLEPLSDIVQSQFGVRSSVLLLNPTTTSTVPDSGSTIALMLGSLSTMAVGRRFLNKRSVRA
jgi:hypothetical protein